MRVIAPVPLREGGEESFCMCKFEAAVAAGGIREFFGGGEASVSSRMRKRLTTRRDWDIFVSGFVCLTYSTAHSNNDNRRQTTEHARRNPFIITCKKYQDWLRKSCATPASAEFRVYSRTRRRPCNIQFTVSSTRRLPTISIL